MNPPRGFEAYDAGCMSCGRTLTAAEREPSPTEHDWALVHEDQDVIGVLCPDHADMVEKFVPKGDVEGIPDSAAQKEIVVYRGGWGFRLPRSHRLHLREDMVSIGIPDGGGTYVLEKVEETDDELRVHVGAELARSSTGVGEVMQPIRPYAFPTLDVEIERLKADWLDAGGDESEFRAWAKSGDGTDESYDDYTSRKREELRTLRRAPPRFRQ